MSKSSMKVVGKKYKKPLNLVAKIKAIEGKAQPAAIALEEAILGALMLDVSAYSRVRALLKPRHFYTEAHQDIYMAIQELGDKSFPIDLLIVTEKLLELDLLKKIGGPVYLVELTNRVASAANLEYHARIVIQKFMRREAIVNCYEAITRCYDETQDVFDARNALADSMRTFSFNSVFKPMTMNERIALGELEEDYVKFAGSLATQGEVVIMFAGAGTGKSLFAVQMMDAITRGNSLFGDSILKNESEPVKGLFIDFELRNRDITNRYSSADKQDKYEFSDLFLSAPLNFDFLDFDDNFEDKVFAEVEVMIQKYKPKVLAFDNLTYLTGESSQDTNIAILLMRMLTRISRKYGVTVIAIGHTTKGNKLYSEALEDDFAGSSQLKNFCTSMFSLKTSAKDSSLVYLKQFKTRHNVRDFDKDGVLVMLRDRVGDKENFTGFEYVGVEPENDHISALDDEDTNEEDLVLRAIERQIADPSLGLRFLVNELGYPKTHVSLRKAIRKEIRNNPAFEIGGDGKPKKAPEYLKSNQQQMQSQRGSGDVPF